MDLGLKGRWAIVGGASKGLGRACARSLAEEGVNIIAVARTQADIERAASEIAGDTDSIVTPVAADLATVAGRDAVLAACPNPDILINNTGGPPPGDFRTFSREMWIQAIDTNMLSAIEMIRLSVDGMVTRRFGRIINITSSAVKSPIPVLGLSNAARAGLTGFVSGFAREVAQHNVTINNLLPGPFDTDRLLKTQEAMARRAGKSLQEFRDQEARLIPARRFGEPEEFGKVCAQLCAAHAGYITAQNILIDGGRFPGLV